MIIFGWIVGVLLLIVGLVGCFFCRWIQSLHEAEVKMMKDPSGGRFEGEPYYMKTFREGRAEGEAMDNARRIILFRRVAFAGGVVIVAVLIYRFVIIKLFFTGLVV